MVELIDIRLEVTEVHVVNLEVLIVLHVVNISPLSIERDVVLGVVLNDVLVVLDGAEAPLALVPSERPLRHEDWLANDALVVADD